MNRTNSYPREWEYVPQIENRYPEPPDNPGFLALPENAQARIDGRFQLGIAITAELNQTQNYLARQAGQDLARRCAQARAKREKAAAAERTTRQEVLDRARRRVRS